MPLPRRFAPDSLKRTSDAREALRQEFGYRCCYCGIHEARGGGPGHFEVDHFRPRSKFPALALDYGNLVYACRTCNGFKADKWPTSAQEAEGYRFLDPDRDRFEEHWEEEADGRLVPTTPAGRYTVSSLNLNSEFRCAERRRRRDVAAAISRNLLLASELDEAARGIVDRESQLAADLTAAAIEVRREAERLQEDEIAVADAPAESDAGTRGPPA